MDMIKIKGAVSEVWIGRDPERGARCSIADRRVAISVKGAPVVCRDTAHPHTFVEGYFAALGIEVTWLDT